MIKNLLARMRFRWIVGPDEYGDFDGEMLLTRIASADEMAMGDRYFVPPNGHYTITRIIHRGEDRYNDGEVYWVYGKRAFDRGA